MLKHNAERSGFLPGIIVIAVIFLLLSYPAKVNGITAPTLETPLLHDWILEVDAGKVTMPSRPYSAIGNEAIAGLEQMGPWIVELEASTFRDTAIARISTEGEYGGNAIVLFDGKNFCLRTYEDIEKVPADLGIGVLVDNKTALAAVTSKHYYLPGFTRGHALTFQPDPVKGIRIEQIPDDQIPEAAKQLDIVPDVDKQRPFIIRPLSGQVVFEAPKFDATKLSTSSEDTGFLGKDVAVVGIEVLQGERKDQQFAWHKRGLQDIDWKTIRRPIGREYAINLLPPLFQKAERREFEPLPHLWPDGSIIFRYAWYVGRQFTFERGLEALVLVALMRQKPEGHPTMLTWEAWYSDTPNDGSSVWRTLRRTWFPDENNAIIDAYPNTEFSTNELVFDVDSANGLVIFLRGGRLWKMKLDN